MRFIIPTLVGLVALAATSVQAAPVQNKAQPHAKAAFRNSRVRRECGPIKDLALRNDCVGSFGAYEPMR